VAATNALLFMSFRATRSRCPSLQGKQEEIGRRLLNQRPRRMPRLAPLDHTQLSTVDVGSQVGLDKRSWHIDTTELLARVGCLVILRHDPWRGTRK